MTRKYLYQVLSVICILRYGSCYGHESWMSDMFINDFIGDDFSQVLAETDTFSQDWIQHDLKSDLNLNTPCEQTEVSFGSIDVKKGGTKLTPTQVKFAPTVKWTAEKDQFYTLLMMDLDAPSRKNPTFREWFHWGVINIPENNVNEGEVITTYMGSTPPKGTGPHRYVILVFQQSDKIKFMDEKIGPNGGFRGGQSAKKIAEKYGLGSPVAGTWFEAEWEG
ncbi:protein D2-like isoform X1 [Styela clava]